MSKPGNLTLPYIVNAYVNGTPVAVQMTVYVIRRKRSKAWGNPESRKP